MFIGAEGTLGIITEGMFNFALTARLVELIISRSSYHSPYSAPPHQCCRRSVS